MALDSYGYDFKADFLEAIMVMGNGASIVKEDDQHPLVFFDNGMPDLSISHSLKILGFDYEDFYLKDGTEVDLELVAELDLLGYMETKTENGIVKRSITFDPTPRNDGKNTCGLPSVMIIPEIINRANGQTTAPNDFIQAQIIEPYKAMIEVKRSEAHKYEQVMDEIREAIELVTDEASANDFIERIDEYEHIGSSKKQAGILINEKAKSLGLVLNKSTKRYEPAETK